MEILKFKLSGETAFFKKPDVNSYYCFTYGNIHKVALLGIFGAILGLGGYAQQRIFNDNGSASKKKDKLTMEYPEFYEKLRDAKVSIVPLNPSGYIAKKVQVFNNSVGYASKEEGGNLIIKEQWLENPKWEVYVVLDEKDATNELKELLKQLKERMLEFKFKYIPYLGKNDHYANINYVEVFNEDDVSFLGRNEVNTIDSLFLKSKASIESNIDKDDILGSMFDSEKKWKYEERLPVELESNCNQYITSSSIYTNFNVKINEESSIYKVSGKNLFFF